MTDRTQPEALMKLADDYAEASFDQGLHKRTLDDAPENARSVLAAAVRRQHARIAELEAQLEAIGAGGVNGPLMGRNPEGISRDDTVHGETYFTAADMATASAQGFRDGAASVAASAGSEPVAWRYVDARGHFRYVGYKPSRDMSAEYPLLKPIRLYLHPSPPEGMVGAWMPIATAPKNGRTLLLGYFNSAGKWRTTRGQWMSQDYIDEYAEDPDFMSPGWHETTVEDDDGKCWPINPTHWIPTPLPPTTSADSKGE